MDELTPTGPRLELMRAIGRGHDEVHGWDFDKPVIVWRVGLAERGVTARVRQLMDHELARWELGGTGEREAVVLTDAGREWLRRHGGQP